MNGIDTVLFDLDGTLVDSAPDLAGTVNEMRMLRGQPELDYRSLRPWAGSGARGMLSAAFGLLPQDAEYLGMRDEFHWRYEARMLQTTQVFASMLPVLDALDSKGVVWGIVTNKALRFAEPMVRALALDVRAKVLVGGDSTPHTKPHPAPLLEAARRLALSPGRCVYVGDDERDMHAGRAAGMGTLAAAWGYLGHEGQPSGWNADSVLAEPHELLKILNLA